MIREILTSEQKENLSGDAYATFLSFSPISTYGYIQSQEGVIVPCSETILQTSWGLTNGRISLESYFSKNSKFSMVCRLKVLSLSSDFYPFVFGNSFKFKIGQGKVSVVNFENVEVVSRELVHLEAWVGLRYESRQADFFLFGEKVHTFTLSSTSSGMAFSPNLANGIYLDYFRLFSHSIPEEDMKNLSSTNVSYLTVSQTV